MRDILAQTLRSILGIFVGLMVITIIAEGIEFLIVTSINGSVTTDVEAYFKIRNYTPVLAAKFLYNTFAAMAGGYLAALIARRAMIWHGGILAAVQAAGLVYGMTSPELAHTTPFWVWVGLLLTMPPVILFGAWLRKRKE